MEFETGAMPPSPTMREGRSLLEDAARALSRRQWNEAILVLEQISELYAKTLDKSGMSEESEELLKHASMARLTRAFGKIAQISLSDREDTALVLQLSQSTIEDLREATTLFERAGSVEDEAYARSLTELIRAKFYEIHGIQQFQAYNYEKAVKYFRTAFTSSDSGLQIFLQASLSRLLDRDRVGETMRNQKEQMDVDSERINSLEASLAKLNERLARYQRLLTTNQEEWGTIKNPKSLANTIRKSLQYAKLSFAIISILIALYFVLVLASSLHITSAFDITLLLSAAWAASTVILILKQTRRFQTSAHSKVQTT